MNVKLVGVVGHPLVAARIAKMGTKTLPARDLALLEIPHRSRIAVAAAEFVTPLRHGGKEFSVLGFPAGDVQGRNARGFLHASDAAGLVQMDGSGALLVEGGFSGAPVWCPDVGGYVGLVVTELSDRGVSWCIPSRLLCRFYNDMLVRFRVPVSDRPRINDYAEDDPNPQLFGTVSDNGERVLTATKKWKRKGKYYVVRAKYARAKGSSKTRGGFVTFITHPSFRKEKEDAFELFAPVNNSGEAEQTFYALETFTIAAIGDGGDTALTLNLEKAKDL